MRTLTRAISTLTLFTTMAGSAAPFEGSLTYRVESGRENQEFSVTVKGEKAALKTPANPGGKVLIDRNTMQATLLLPQQKMYMEMPADKFVPNASEATTGEFQVTDEEKRILGYTTRKVIYTDEGETSEIWMTGQLGSFQLFQGPLSGPPPPEVVSAFPNGALPLEISTTGGGKPTLIRVTAIERNNVPDAELEIPTDYQPIRISGADLPGMR